MQEEARPWLAASFVRSRWMAQGIARSRIAIAAGFGLALLFLMSIIFNDAFAKAGITPASILLGAVLVSFSSTCGSDPLHPARLLSAVLALGFVVGPVVHALTGVYSLPDGSERQQAKLGGATWMVLSGSVLAMVCMRTILGNEWRRDLHAVKRATLSRRTLIAAAGVSAAGIVLLGLYLLLTGASSVSLEGRGATYTVLPDEGRKAYLGLLAPIGVGGLLVIAAWALERGSRLTLVFASAASLSFGVVMALPGSRANFLYAIAPLFFLYAAYKGLPRWRWLAIAGAALTVLLVYGASLRTADARSALLRSPKQTLVEKGPSRLELERSFLVDVAHTEPLLGAMDAYPATRPFLGGESLAIGFSGPVGWRFGQLIGLRFDPPAGVTLTAVAYGRDPSSFQSGLTATLPGELYANAGVPGVLFGLAAFGAISGWLRRRSVLSHTPGSLALYSAAITVLFAVFSDYFGQIYRGGAVVVGVALALVIGREKTVKLTQVAVAGSLIACLAAGLLILRRYLGAPPDTLMTSDVLVVLTVALFVAFLTTYFLRKTQLGLASRSFLRSLLLLNLRRQ